MLSHVGARERRLGYLACRLDCGIWRWGTLSVLLFTFCSSPGQTPDKPGTTEEAAVETSSPPDDTLTLAKYPLQDNPLAGCSICHVDVEDEFVGNKHFEQKVGCQTCHGPSEGHLADENNEVKPDRLFTRKNVDQLCGPCHECGRPNTRDSAVGADGQPMVCTDCHGYHDLSFKTTTAGADGICSSGPPPPESLWNGYMGRGCCVWRLRRTGRALPAQAGGDAGHLQGDDRTRSGRAGSAGPGDG